MKLINWIYGKARHFIHALLAAVIQFQINNEMFNNHNKFKRGDWLKYNWKAKIYIDTVVKKKSKPRQFDKYIFSGDNVEFTDGDSCSAFWVRKLHFWERHS
jgi:hypothetical protein